MKLTHTRLSVDDVPACFRFYRDVMGLPATFGTEEDVYADFDAGGTTLALFARSLMHDAVGRDVGGPGQMLLVFEADNVDAELARLQNAGVAVVAPAQNRPEWGIRTGHILDPAGTLIEIYSSLGSEAPDAD